MKQWQSESLNGESTWVMMVRFKPVQSLIGRGRASMKKAATFNQTACLTATSDVEYR